MDFELRIMSYRKSVFFARLKQISPCLSGFCERGKRASQMLASIMPFAENASRAKTVLISEICVKKISVSPVSSVAIKKLSLWPKIFQPKISNYAKQTQSNPISVMAEQGLAVHWCFLMYFGYILEYFGMRLE